MARLNVEERFFTERGRLVVMGRHTGGIHSAIGHLILLWHGSQSMFRERGTKDQILMWMEVPSLEIGEDAFRGLVAGGYITAAKTGDEYVIHGNEVQIESTLARQRRGIKGGEQNRRKWRERKKNNRELEAIQPPSVMDTSANLDPSPMQGNARQCKAGQSKAGQEDIPGAAAPPGGLTLLASPAAKKPKRKTGPAAAPNPLNGETWEAYRSAYSKRYGVDPVRNAQTNAQISNFVKRIGAESPLVVTFFVQHPERFYVQKLHALGLALHDAEKLRTEWATGKAMTARAAQNSEARSHNAAVIDQFRDRE